MSRFTGPQGPGAARRLAAERRAQAEARQRAEQRREAKRRARQAAPPRPLTEAERAALHRAAVAVELARRLTEAGLPWPLDF